MRYVSRPARNLCHRNPADRARPWQTPHKQNFGIQVFTTRTCLDCCYTSSTSSFVTPYSVRPAQCSAQEPQRAMFCCMSIYIYFFNLLKLFNTDGTLKYGLGHWKLYEQVKFSEYSTLRQWLTLSESGCSPKVQRLCFRYGWPSNSIDRCIDSLFSLFYN